MNDGAPPGPDPKAIRPSMVDSGWSVPPPQIEEPALPPPPPSTGERRPQPASRPLPSYEAHETGVRDVTMVDREIQTRAKAMREKETLPPPRRASAFPPPPPVVRSQGAPVGIRGPGALASPLPGSSRPPPPPSRPSAPPASPSRPPAPPAPPSLPPAPAGAATDAEAHGVSAARSAATLMRPRTSQSPQPLPSFGAALAQRVRFAGGEVPLWSLVTPLVLLVALGTAFAAAAVTSAADPNAAQPPKLSAEPSASVAQLPAPLPPAPLPGLTASAEDKPKPLTLLERVAVGDDAAVKELSAKPVSDLRVAEAIALSLGQSAQDVRAARALRDRVDHDPGLIKDPDVLTQLRRYTEDPETARDALSAIANVPGPISADLIYEVWTATASRTTATDLARSLIYSKEVRAKASPALAIALDVRDADTCEKNRDLIDRVTADGDRRTFHVLGKLTRKYGCGANKRADCYACLRSGTDLDAAMKAVKARREPHPFGS
ncbi:MAG: hypothetical protein ABI548_03590 [Polyangiaceae bacterium]